MPRAHSGLAGTSLVADSPMERWAWTFRYAMACRLGPHGVSASDVVRFLGYGAALVLIWLAADRTALELPEDSGWRTLLRNTLVPLATLIVLAWSYTVPLLL